MGRESSSVPPPPPPPSEMAQCPTDACLQCCPTQLGAFSLGKGDGGKQCEREASKFALLPLLSLSFSEDRILVASWVPVTPFTLSFTLGLGVRPKGPRQPPFPARSSPGEEALAVIVENCPAKKVVAGKVYEGEVGQTYIFYKSQYHTGSRLELAKRGICAKFGKWE